MADPATLEEYNRLQNARMSISGFGTTVAISSPCPFCCAPDVMTYRMLEVDAAMRREYACNECARAFTFHVERDPQQVRFELVQTRGPDPAAYLPPMRRADKDPQ